MSKSIANQVRSMAKEKVDKRIAECADEILTSMKWKFKSYMVENDFPTVYNAEILIVLDKNWHDFTFTEIQMAVMSLDLDYKTNLGKHFIKMSHFVKGGKMNRAQKLYKKMRPIVMEEIKEQRKKERAERRSARIQYANETQKARTQANAYLAEVFNELKAGHFSAIQSDYFKYLIRVEIPFQESKYISTIQEEQVKKTFKKHHFYLVSLKKTYCEFVIDTF